MSSLDLPALENWLNATLSGPAAPIRAEPVSGGASNLIYKLERAGKSYALRLPPQQRNDASADTILREMTLMRALAASAIPHARLITSHTDRDILGVPFMLMEWVDGSTPVAPLPDHFTTANFKRRLCEDAVDTLACIANARWRELGLENFGKPNHFLARQVTRWRGQFERSPVRQLDHVDALSDWLSDNTPAMQRAALIHGDYTFVNIMVARDQPHPLVAVIDWELATIGDPLIDLGWLLACWQEPGELPSHATYFDWRDMPSRASLANRYAHATGLDVARLDFYMALALFKFAAIMEGWYAAYRAGRSNHPTHASMEAAVPRILDRAAMFAGLIGGASHE